MNCLKEQQDSNGKIPRLGGFSEMNFESQVSSDMAPLLSPVFPHTIVMIVTSQDESIIDKS